MGKRFREPDSSNPQGFYEDLDFRDLNQKILEGKCSIDYFQEQLDQLISKSKGIKDPRISHLWRYYQKHSARYILCTRRPQLIVRSMMANYGWSEEESKQLLITRLNGIYKLLEGRDALRIDFSNKRKDSELTNLLQRFIT